MSDNDLDAELLALAGGDESSSDEEDIPQSSHDRATDGAKNSGEKSPPRRGVAQKLKSRGRARRPQRDSDEEDSFGGSDVESSPRKARSPSDAGEIHDDAPLYPIEGKFRSDADRADIMAMTEIEREEILAERAAEIQRRAQDQQLKKLLQSSRRDVDADGKKRKAEDAELDDGQRKSSRQKTKATDKIEAYKRQRELKGAQRARGEERLRDRQSPSQGGDYSDRDASGESEVEWDDRRRASPPAPKDEPPPDVEDFDRIRIGRSNFAKFMFDPNFESLVKGCYCRVNCGQDTTGPKYRLGLIKGFRDGRPYTMEGQNGKKIFTNQYAIIGHGKKEREYAFAACSDGRLTISEFSEFKHTSSEDGIRFPTRRQTDAKLAELKSMVRHTWSEGDIQSKVDKMKAMRKIYADYHRERITRRLDDAKSRGDDATVARCNKDLLDLDAGGAVGSVSKSMSPAKKENQQARLAQLNKANRKTNSEEIRKALIAETLARQKARAIAIARAKEEEARKLAAAEAAAQNGLKVPGVDDDLFGEASDISRTATPVNGTPKNGRSRGATPLNGVREKKAFGQFSRKKMDDEVIAAMDLDIDIDI